MILGAVEDGPGHHKLNYICKREIRISLYREVERLLALRKNAVGQLIASEQSLQEVAQLALLLCTFFDEYQAARTLIDEVVTCLETNVCGPRPTSALQNTLRGLKAHKARIMEFSSNPTHWKDALQIYDRLSSFSIEAEPEVRLERIGGQAKLLTKLGRELDLA